MNTKIRSLEDQIVNLLNASDVPIEVKRLILADIMTLVNKEADRIIKAEIKMGGQEDGLCEN